MARKTKSITDPKLSLNILSQEDLQNIHDATLDIIENVGVRFPSRTRWKSGNPTVRTLIVTP